jgi:hypothetical protein
MGLKCDDCGKFIGFADLQTGAARCWYTGPTHPFEGEKCNLRCKKCVEKETH